MQARLFSGRIDLIVKKLQTAIQNEIHAKMEDKDFDDFQPTNTKKLIEHLNGLYQTLLPRLNIGVGEFQTIELLDQYFESLRQELATLIDDKVVSKEGIPSFVQFCRIHNLNIDGYRNKIFYLSNIVHVHHLLARLKFFLGLLADNETAENYGQAIAKLDHAYAEKLKRPMVVQEDIVNSEAQVVSIVCHQASLKLKEKGYVVEEWLPHSEWVAKTTDKRTDSILKWLHCLPSGKPVGDKKSQACAVRGREVVDAVNNKFYLQVEKIEKIKNALADIVSDTKSFEKTVKPQVDRILKIKEIIFLIKNAFRPQHDKTGELEPMLEKAISRTTRMPMKQHHLFFDELYEFLNEYGAHFCLLENLERNKTQLAEVISGKSKLLTTLCQQLEAAKRFWSKCVASILFVADRYETLAKQMVPRVNLKQTIKEHWPLLLMGGLLIGCAAAPIGFFLLMLPPLYLSLLIAGGVLAGVCVALNVALTLDCFKPVKLPPMAAVEVSSLLGPLPNQSHAQFEHLKLAPDLKSRVPPTSTAARSAESTPPASELKSSNQSAARPRASAISSLKC